MFLSKGQYCEVRFMFRPLQSLTLELPACILVSPQSVISLSSKEMLSATCIVYFSFVSPPLLALAYLALWQTTFIWNNKINIYFHTESNFMTETWLPLFRTHNCESPPGKILSVSPVPSPLKPPLFNTCCLSCAFSFRTSEMWVPVKFSGWYCFPPIRWLPEVLDFLTFLLGTGLSINR